MIDVLVSQSEQEASRTAYTFAAADGTSRHLSYVDLLLQAGNAARSIATHCQPGDRVLVLLPPGLDYVVALFGALLAGAIAVPAYLPHNIRRLPRITAIVEDCDPALIITPSAHGQLGPTINRLTENGRRRVSTFDNLQREEGEWRPPLVSRDAPAFIQYTSGSTGSPRGVVLTHANVMANLGTILRATACSRDTVSASWVPPYHDMGLIGSILLPLYGGFHSILMSPTAFVQQPYRWLKIISDHRVTFSGGPNFAYDSCVRRCSDDQRASLRLDSWRVAYSSAEPIRARTLTEFARTFATAGFDARAFFPCYGLAEATLLVAAPYVGRGGVVQWLDKASLERHRAVPASAGADTAVSLVSCGRAIDQHVRVVRPETLEPCSESEIGEIWISGDNVATGYWGDHLGNESTFGARVPGDSRDYLRTGDLGALIDGDLYLTGRIKDLLIIAGRNIYPHDVERAAEGATLRVVPGRTAAFAMNGDDRERLVVVCELGPRPGTDLDTVLADLRNAVVDEISAPVDRVMLIKCGSMPVTSSGKLRRSACRDLLMSGTLAVLAEWKLDERRQLPLDGGAPSGAGAKTSSAITAWIVERLVALGIDRRLITDDDGFAAYGIGSVDAVSILAGLSDWLDRDLPETLLWDYPTIGQLARHLASSAGAGESVGHARQVDRSLSPRYRTTVRSHLEDQSIGIVGLGCRMPGADTIEELWTLLSRGIDAVTRIPLSAHAAGSLDQPTSHWGGLLRDVDAFDARFFGISAAEAAEMDPQQQLLLEVSWHALEHAGIDPRSLRGSDAGVFVGISGFDAAQVLFDVGEASVYYATGNAHSLAANRLSYFYDLCGPSLAVDTACSSSLVAVHLACETLRRSDCSLALAGGVNVLLDPALTVALSQAQFLAPDGRCKTFDTAADGYVRGEGCGMIVLKRLSDCRRDGTRVLAVIRSSAINQDGRTNGLTAPNGLSQSKLIRRAIERAGVAPRIVSYVEAHGTGTALGDPIEISALQTVVGEGRSVATPLHVGSIKTNIGHLEAAAGVAGLLKVVLALMRRSIPAHLHLRKLNPRIRPEGLVIPTTTTEWKPIEGRRVAGVSSFGFGGTNAFVVVEESVEPPRDRSAYVRPLHVLALSGRTPEALRNLARLYRERLSTQDNRMLADLCYSANARRTTFGARLAIVAHSSETMAERLDAFLAGRTIAGLWQGQPAGAPEIVFLFSGQGAQFSAMGRELYDTNPVFRELIDLSDRGIGPGGRVSLRDVLLQDGADRLIDRTEYAQPALFALQAALCTWLGKWGIRPAWVIGHSVGEVAAGCASGALTTQDALSLVIERGRQMQAAPTGAMAAVFAGHELVGAEIARTGEPCTIAAMNGPSNTVISGDAAAVNALSAALQRQGVGVVPLHVSHAFHSRSMTSIADDFATFAKGIPVAPVEVNWILAASADLAPRGGVDASYWGEQMVRPVRFADAVAALPPTEDRRAFVEIGPHPVLLPLLADIVGRPQDLRLPTLTRGSGDWVQVLATVAELYVSGIEVDWEAFDRRYHRDRIATPLYPFERSPPQRRPSRGAPYRRWAAATAYSEPLCSTAVDRARWLYEVEWRRIDRPGVQPTKGASLPSPTVMAESLDGVRRDLESSFDLARYGEGYARLCEMATAAAVVALRTLGLGGDEATTISLRQFAKDVSLVPTQVPLVRRLLRMLEEDGVLISCGDETWTIGALPVVNPIALGRCLSADHPDMSHEIRLLRRCAIALPGVLLGELSGIDVLFPAGDAALVEHVYRQSIGARCLNQLVRRVIGELASNRTGPAALRVLEIGAGTGATTSAVLAALQDHAPDAFEFTVTDVSPSFLTRAKATFHAEPHLRYRLLDIERPPVNQGFADTYEIIVAANVLHATAQLSSVLSHINAVVAPGGVLVLVEGVQPSRFLDLTFGLTDGWWRSAADGRDYPLQSVGEWTTLLASAGFDEIQALSPAHIGQSVIIARRPVAHHVPKPRRLVFAQPDALGLEIVGRLAAEGMCVAAYPGSTFADLGEGRYQINPNDASGYAAVLQFCASQGGLTDVVFVADFGHGESRDDALPSRTRAVCVAALRAIQATLQTFTAAKPATWLVTTAAQPVGAVTTQCDLAALSGLANVAALEYPDYSCVCVDLEDGSRDSLSALFSEIATGPSDPHVAFRDGQRYAARLTTRPPSGDRPVPTLALSPQATYWVVGGLGGLGLLTAEVLVSAGARHLMLSGRSKPSADVAVRIDQWRASGVDVRMQQADVSQRSDVRAVLQAIDGTMPQLRGVIHSAGVLDDALLPQQDDRTFQRVFDAKVAGAWWLHKEMEQRSLDFFVLYSSAAAILGSPGQANHAAANAFLDALAHLRQRSGRRALTINWGLWSSIGSATADGVSNRLAAAGVGAISPDAGAQVLREQLLSSSPQLAVIALDAATLARGPMASSGQRRYLEELLPETPPSSVEAAASAHAPTELESAGDMTQRARTTSRRLSQHLAAQLGVETVDEKQPFRSLGIDSLMAISLQAVVRKEFGVDLPIADIFSGATAESLARAIVERRPEQSEVATPPAPEVVESGAGVAHDDAVVEGNL